VVFIFFSHIHIGMEVVCHELERLYESGLAYTRVVKAFRNRLGDGACTALHRLLVLQGKNPEWDTHMEELHLSHNRISISGALTLLDACKFGASQKYSL